MTKAIREFLSSSKWPKHHFYVKKWFDWCKGLKMDDKVEIDLCEGSDEGFESLQDNYIVKHFLDRRCNYRSLGTVFCFGDKYFEYPFLCLKDGRFYLIYTKRFLDNFARELNWSTGLIFHGKSYDSKCD